MTCAPAATLAADTVTVELVRDGAPGLESDSVACGAESVQLVPATNARRKGTAPQTPSLTWAMVYLPK